MDKKTNPFISTVYGITLIVALFTGFGNMPLWGRYYIADVPGLGWSGDFFINVNVHILAGSLLLAIGVYAFMLYGILGKRASGKLTLSGKIRAFFFVLTLTTGILMAVKNLPGVNFPLEMLMAFNFTHMGAAVLMMIVSLIALIFRRPRGQGR